MPRMRKQPNRYWSKEEKIRVINRVLIDVESSRQVSLNENISAGMLTNWIKKYLQDCEDSLENKRKLGNPLIKYSRRKELTTLEQLEYENI